MKKYILIIVAITFVLVIVSGLVYYNSMVQAEELKKRNETIKEEIKAYFQDLNTGKGYDGKELGYVLEDIVIRNITPESDAKVKVDISVTYYTDDPQLIQEYVSRVRDVMESSSTSFNQYLSPEYVKSISFNETWEAVFIKNGNQWKLESINRVGSEG